MLAKCAKCQHVFNADRYGQQYCPGCGSELFVADPGAAGGPTGPGAWGTPPPPSGGWQGAGSAPPADGSQDQSTPWELRAQKGFFPALVETAKASMAEPTAFFGRMRVDNAAGVIGYYWLVAGLSTLIGGLWDAALAGVNLGFSPDQLPPGLDPQILQWVQNLSGPGPALYSAVAGVALAPIGLFVVAGVVHLFALLFGCARNGFDATLRSVGYSAAPLLLAAVPMCGRAVGSIWYVVLVVIGLIQTQRTTTGRAVGAVLSPFGLLICCCCAGVLLLAGVMGAAAAMGSR